MQQTQVSEILNEVQERFCKKSLKNSHKYGQQGIRKEVWKRERDCTEFSSKIVGLDQAQEGGGPSEALLKMADR
jgi:hypothetical protein